LIAHEPDRRPEAVRRGAPPLRHVTYTASAETASGYDLRLRCTSGQSYYVYVTPEIEADDFLAQAERN
jgi:hypothetical protein